MAENLRHMVTEPIQVDRLEQQVGSHRNGAVVTFVGRVRNHSRGKTVAYLEYDAYIPMAERIIGSIERDAAERWGVDVAIQHRLGRLELGEASVVVCVGAPHRAEAFEACRYCIDTLKETVPIWKKEVCPDGSFWIEGDSAIPAQP